LMGTGSDKLRLNPRKSWYANVEQVGTSGDYEVTFHLKQPQPALLALLASGWAPIYPCHVPARDMRQHPIGTGPFKFGAFKPNEYIKVTKNPDYWKPGRPYLDGIEYTIMREPGPRDLAFYAGKFDMTTPFGVSIPTLKDFKTQAPQAICEISHVNVPRTMLINPAAPPFDNPELRRAMTLSVDRKAFVDIKKPSQPLHSSKIVKRRNRHHATYYGPIAPAGSHDFPSGVTSRLRSTKTTKATREGPPGGHCADPGARHSPVTCLQNAPPEHRDQSRP